MTGMRTSVRDLLMRYTPLALALSLAVAVTSSASLSSPPEKLDPRAQALLAEGGAAMEGGRFAEAANAYESALTVEPGSVTVLLELAEATRRMGLQGKALHYYRVALESDPKNLAAIAGEGVALAEKGAIERASKNLAQLKSMCGADCSEVRQLSAVIARGPLPKMAAESVTPKPVSDQ
jgi:Tfp pilus assembly protein PilF